jgi:hypothetical protein
MNRISPLTGHAGYLLIDNSNSPGVPEEICRAAGVPFAKPGEIFEADTYVCAHCHSVVIKNPNRVRPREVCRKCMRIVCDNPGCAIECLPFEKVLDDLQNQRS